MGGNLGAPGADVERGPPQGEGMRLGERAEDVSLWIGKLPI